MNLYRGTLPFRAVCAALTVLVAAALLWASNLAEFRVSQLTSVLIYAIAICGLNLATGYTGLLSIGHSAFFGLGAYVTGVLVVKYGWEPLSTVPVAIVACFVVGWIIGLPALRIRGLYLALVTLAVGVAFPELVRRFEDLTGGARGLIIRRRLLAPPQWTGLTLGDRTAWMYWLSAGLLILTLLVVRLLVRSRIGMAMVATRDNEIAAAASGVSVATVKTAVFGLSGAITGMAGCLFAMYLAALSPDGSFTLLKSIEFITGLVIGGSATQLGPVIGAFAIVYLPYWTANLGGQNISRGQLSGVIFGAILIAIVFLMPEGLAGGAGRLGAKFIHVHPAADRPRRDNNHATDTPAPQQRAAGEPLTLSVEGEH
jgi:branched-chain amino acid transport system permease protein